MPLSLPTTKGQWMVAGVVLIAMLIFLLAFTRVFKGEAVEVTLVNATSRAVFAYIDNTGRHGQSMPMENIKANDNTMTPDGLRVQPGTTRTFGLAVGLFDMPTMHILPIDDAGVADRSTGSDCVFNTYNLRKFELPSFQAKVKWTVSGCEVSL